MLVAVMCGLVISGDTLSYEETAQSKLRRALMTLSTLDATSLEAEGGLDLGESDLDFLPSDLYEHAMNDMRDVSVITADSQSLIQAQGAVVNVALVRQAKVSACGCQGFHYGVRIIFKNSRTFVIEKVDNEIGTREWVESDWDQSYMKSTDVPSARRFWGQSIVGWLAREPRKEGTNHGCEVFARYLYQVIAEGIGG